MGNPRGVRLDFEALEKLRLRTLGLWERGETRAAIARRVGVVPRTMARRVSQYWRQIGSHARQTIERGYCIQIWGPRFVKLLEDIADSEKPIPARIWMKECV